MSSRLASASKSPPRRVIMPALPLVPRPSNASTPPIASPMGGADALTEDMSNLKVDDAHDAAINAPILTGAATTPPPSGGPKTDPIVQDTTGISSKGVPAIIEPSADDDVFGGNTSTHVSNASNSVAQRIVSNLRGPAGYNGFAPRPDRVSQFPNAANAQGLYPPDALLFVANLSNQRTEDQLEVACHQAFDGFGPCHVKVRRDKNTHPFAFIQFEMIEDARAAISGGSSMVIDGRKIRIERAKAERAVILSKTDGSPVTETEARGILERYGPIELCVPTNTGRGHEYAMAFGIYAKFAYYLDCRDALRSFQHHTPGYLLHMAPSLEPRIRFGPNGFPVIRGFATPRSAVDQKSIYVGNLPEETTRDELEEMFLEYGNIVQVNIIKKTFPNDGINHFAFVEFSNPQEADYASAAERYLHGTKLRVEPKEYSARRGQRSTYVPAPPMPHSNAPHTYGDNGNQYAPHHPQYNTPDMYGHGNVAQMTPPTTAYVQNHAMGMQHSYTPHDAAGPFVTPPSHSAMNRIIPMGIFSPTPTHGMTSYSTTPYAPPPFNTHHIMGPIAETREEEGYN